MWSSFFWSILTPRSRQFVVRYQQLKHQNKVWSLFKVNNRDIRATWMRSFWCLYFWFWVDFIHCFGVSIQVNAIWGCSVNEKYTLVLFPWYCTLFHKFCFLTRKQSRISEKQISGKIILTQIVSTKICRKPSIKIFGKYLGKVLFHQFVYVYLNVIYLETACTEHQFMSC